LPAGGNVPIQSPLMHNGILDSMPGPGGNGYYNNNRRYNNTNNYNNGYNNNNYNNNRMNSYNNSGYSAPSSSYYQDWSKPMPVDEALEKYVLKLNIK
jgi:hypothetical protein